MSNGKLIIIGGDAAGMGAASKIRREQPDRQIVVFEKGNHTSYAACGIPYYVAGMVGASDDLIARKPEVFIEKQNIDVRIRHQVMEINAENKKVKVLDLEKKQELWESYDELLIATGASPVVPPIEGADAEGVFALSNLQSGIDVFEFMNKHNPVRAVVVGGGYIGIEMAEALLERGLHVSLIDMAPQLMTTLDEDMAEHIMEYMLEQGVQVFLREKLEQIEQHPDGKVKQVITDKQTLDADIVILGLGVKPNSEVAAKAGIRLGEKNAICVKKTLETSVPGIWAAGDCAESYHLIKQQQTWVALGTVANKHALVAGINISGGNTEFPGVLGTAITKFKELEIARTGLSEKEANEMNIPFKANTIESSTLSGYYPGADKIRVKLVVEDDTGRLLGGQIVGMKSSGKRIDTLATAIAAGMTARQLADLDLSYAPPFSPVWDPVQTAARTLL